jgi:protein O-GlcNAc transferase
LSMFNRTVHIDKKNYKGFINIANIYELEGNHKSVIEACNKALFLKPDFEDARSKKLYQQAQICDWNGISNDKGFIPNLGINKQSIAPFSLLSLEDAPERHRKRSEIFTKDKFFLSPIEFNIRHKQQSRKIRVGYFSADFKEHVVSRLIIPILERHNRNDFQIYGYSIKPTNEDYIKKQLISSFDVYRDVTQITDKEIALLAREDEIDIAIDLNGYTQNSRTRIFAYRAAPIQISYLGYPGTMGASFMDYIIADHNLIPESSQSFYSEKPIYLPNTYMPGNNNSEISKRHLSREELGLPQNAFVFCAINNSYKITPQVFEIWTRLLQKVKGSVLWLLSPNDDVKFNLIRAASVNGISSDRLVFAEPKPYEEYIAQFSKADLFLDTFIYNAGATANHVLWAGLPIVTKIGKSYTSRMAASMLNAVGLGELVTKTDKEYEDLIFDLATNTEKLKRVREKLSKNRLSEPLFDTELYIRHLEEGYRRVYENYTQGNKTKIINII